ncbi:interferon-induced protein 44 isoform 2-T3 [Pholidichthys leucotaenia]
MKKTWDSGCSSSDPANSTSQRHSYMRFTFGQSLATTSQTTASTFPYPIVVDSKDKTTSIIKETEPTPSVSLQELLLTPGQPTADVNKSKRQQGRLGGVNRKLRYLASRAPLFSSRAESNFDSPWRNMEWTEERKTSLMEMISSYRPSCEDVAQARVLLLGPVGSGKSSFISSVQSVFNGRVTNRAMVGSFASSFTKKTFSIRHQKRGDVTGLVLCDMMGLTTEGMSGLTLHDILSVIKGHVPEGHKFSPDQPVSSSETVGYVKRPSLQDKIHCVAFVVDASKVMTNATGLSITFKKLREHISDLGVHQVVLLTHVDQICSETAKDATNVYKSRIIQDMMKKTADLLGMSTSYIVPVKNYSSELDVDVNTDVLILSAVDHILQYADLYFQDSTPKNTGSKLDL